jgi:sulfide:quinone oxidoreductase
MAPDGSVPVDPRTLATRFPGVRAVGEVADMDGHRAGALFAEGAARMVVRSPIAEWMIGETPSDRAGRGARRFGPAVGAGLRGNPTAELRTPNG